MSHSNVLRRTTKFRAKTTDQAFQRPGRTYENMTKAEKDKHWAERVAWLQKLNQLPEIPNVHIVENEPSALTKFWNENYDFAKEFVSELLHDCYHVRINETVKILTIILRIAVILYCVITTSFCIVVITKLVVLLTVLGFWKITGYNQ